jgi:death-on-curing family protein
VLLVLERPPSSPTQSSIGISTIQTNPTYLLDLLDESSIPFKYQYFQKISPNLTSIFVTPCSATDRMASAVTMTYRFLTPRQIQRIHQIYVSQNPATQPELLDSASNGPMNAKHYGNQDNVFQLAANLSDKLMRNHPFLDGNKRTAMAAADMFLKINGYKLQDVPLDPGEENNQGFTDAHVAVVTNQWSTDQLGKYYESVAKPLNKWTAAILEFKEAAQEY